MNQERIFKVLLGPHVSEKATVLADGQNQFVFKVDSTATKLEINGREKPTNGFTSTNAMFYL